MDLSSKAILISGGSGLIGTALVGAFSERGVETRRLVRRMPDGHEEIGWNPDAPEAVGDLSRLESAGAVIHLSGANLSAHRWTARYKREIADSRIRTTASLVDLLKKLKNPPMALLCASAVGIYADCGDEILTEAALPGQGFLADTCRAWEAEAEIAAEAGIRVAHLRFGVVLSRAGGALKQLQPIFRAGLGGRLGSGRQWMSWIAIGDLVRAVAHILQTDSLHGPVNLVAPIPVTNREFTRALGNALRRPATLPVPRFALRAAFGEMADEVLMASVRAVPERLAAAGFHFDFSEINGALRAIL